MNENNIFEERTQAMDASGKKPLHVASLVLGILSIVFGLLIALVGDILGIIGIVMANSKKQTHSTKAGLICSIIGLVISICNHILAFVLTMAMFA